VAIKCGADGALARSGAAIAHAPVAPIAVVDTVGAGDSFDAGFVYGSLHGWPLDRSLRFAVRCGALSTRAAGGTAAQATLAEALEVP
jgi:sugar/nucleoside kinase (ribokinase family)